MSSEMMEELMEDRSRVLPPLTQIEPEKEPLPASVNARSHQVEEEPGEKAVLGSSSKSPEIQQHPKLPQPVSPVTSQIQQPSPGPTQSPPSSTIPNSQSEQVEVKSEMTEVPSPMIEMTAPESAKKAGSSAATSRRPSVAGEGTPVPKKIAALKSEASKQSTPVPAAAGSSSPKPSLKPSPKPSPKPSAKPKASTTKKRAAPKKGTASAKPAAKKRKIETESIPSTPALPRTQTPASGRASKTPVPKNPKQGSVTPARSSSVTNPALENDIENEDDNEDDDGMSIDENELFCICRGPDDHTWMIACDGGCDDWFHGRCVGMDEKDGKLIEKYICPNCVSLGDRGQTLWKPMCRLDTCRKPARVEAKNPSKYCSDEHGQEFMRARACKGEIPSSPKRPPPVPAGGGRRKSRKDNYTDNFANGADSAGYDELGDDGGACLRGGILRPSELKTLASSTSSIDEFRALGDAVLSHTQSTDDYTNSDGPIHPSTVYTAEEATQLSDIETKRNELKERKKMLDDRETFLGMVKSRGKSVLDELKKKEKSAAICGFDPRLAWADEEFEIWRASPEGKGVFEAGKLGPTFLVKEEPDQKPKKEETKKENKNKKKGNNRTHTNGDTELPPADTPKDLDAEAENDKDPIPEDTDDAATKGICTKKRCPRHRDWLRVQTNNIQLDKESVRVEMKRLLADEKGLRERATIRCLEES